jgi:hypothetical protein
MSTLLTYTSTPPPPLKLLPTLSINAKGRVYLSRDLMERLGLRDGQPANVVPPADPTKDPCWHLDLRSKCRHKVSIYKSARPRIEFIKLPSGLIAPGQPLRLQLVPGDPEFIGWYPLLPDAYFAPKQAPALAANAA